MTTTKPPTQATILANRAVLASLPFNDVADFDGSAHGKVADLRNGGLVGEQDRPLFNPGRWSFVTGAAPDTVNPSLWRQATLMAQGTGLFKLADRVYQVTGQDLSNMIIIEGDTGLIISDTLMSKETAENALALYYEHRPHLPVKNVIFTHSHGDHFGGVKGVVCAKDIAAGTVQVWAPGGFTEEAISENVLLGAAMIRRGMYMYGSLLPAAADGQLSAGLGLATSHGTSTFAVPTQTIAEPVERHVIDGLTFEFMLAPGTEAPAEMWYFIEDLLVLCAAEDVTHNLHNIYTLRGAKTRDAKAWSGYIDEALWRYGNKAEVLCAQHHWPTWGGAKIRDILASERDMYKYLHDQTLRLVNLGLTPAEIAEDFPVPDSLAHRWFNRGYYGSVSHNVKAIYDFYLGWFDAVPAHLNPHTPTEAGKRYVDLAGGPDELLRKAAIAFEAGDYRWVAELVNHLVFADPKNTAARVLLADAYEQLGYQAENGTWRNFYLTGAQELRVPVKQMPANNPAGPDVVAAMPVADMLDFWSVRLNGPRAASFIAAIRITLTDTGEEHLVQVSNGAMRHHSDRPNVPADATISLTRQDFNAIYLDQMTLPDAIATGKATLTGDRTVVDTFMGLLDTFQLWFNVIEP